MASKVCGGLSALTLVSHSECVFFPQINVALNDNNIMLLQAQSPSDFISEYYSNTLS